MKVAIVGTRGIPANYGGFETFAQELAIVMAKSDMSVCVYCDKSDTRAPESFKGIELHYASTTKTKNPLLYYYVTIKAALKTSDIVLVTGTGGSLFYFLNIFKRKIIVTNCDGVESRRAKWSFLKKTFIRITEFFAMKYSRAIISDSQGIEKYLKEKYSKKIHGKIHTIEYGAVINTTEDQSALQKFKLNPDEYYLVVSRLEPENNIHLIIDGYKKSKTDRPLIIVGNLQEKAYVQELQSHASDSIRFIGGVYDPDELATLRKFCFVYVHGHSVGGTNPSLIEALGSGNICLCHDNEFNREVTESKMFYFDEQNFQNSIEIIENLEENKRRELNDYAVNRIASHYNWESITERYLALFSQLQR